MKSLKIGLLRLQGAVDYIKSGFGVAPDLTLLRAALTGAVVSVVGAVFIGVVNDADMNDASEYFEDQLTIRNDGQVYKFPDSCDMDYDYYLIGKDASGKAIIAAGASDELIDVLPLGEQKSQFYKVKSCLTDLGDDLKVGDYNFSEQFFYVANVTYSSPFILQNAAQDEKSLKMDILVLFPCGCGESWRLDNTVRAADDYNVKGGNDAIYKREFATAAAGFAAYEQAQAKTDVYLDGALIKNTDQYPVYTDPELTMKGIIGLMGGSFLLSLGLMVGPFGSREGTGYCDRSAARRKKMVELKIMDGRDGPLM